MADPQAALATQVRNIETKTGKSLAELKRLLDASGASKHGEKRSWLMEHLGLGHGDANTVVHLAAQADAPPAAAGADPLDEIYAGPKAGLRPLHDRVIAAIDAFGAYEATPKKAYVSLRRNKQFAMVGPATRDQIEIGLNAKALPAHARLKAQAPGGMCQYKVRIASAADVDADLVGWLRTAYDGAG